MQEYNPETHVAVPKAELEKLEQARVELYKFLEYKLNEFELNTLVYLTRQMYNVANRKKWGD